jgi:TRAP-type transport system small permease protein
VILTKLYRMLCSTEAVIAGTFLVLMVGLVFTNGVARLLGYPINWAIDIATCLFAWAAFLCADIAWRKNSLMSINILTSQLSETAQKALRLFNYLVIVVFLGYVMVMGTYLSWISRARSFQGIPEISYSWVTMSMPIGGLLLLITTALKIREELRPHPHPDRPGPETAKSTRTL